MENFSMKSLRIALRAFGLAVATVVVLNGCGGDSGSGPRAVVTVTTVTVSPTTVTIITGATQQLTATTKDANGNTLTGRVVVWSSSDQTKATVSASGLVTAVAVGTATITATSEGQSGTSTATIMPIPVATVTVSPTTPTIITGATQQLSATTKDATGNTLTGRVVAWSSSDQTKATVSASGLVTAVAVGTATITATSEGQSGTANVAIPTPLIGILSSSTTWTVANSPYRLIGDVQVAHGTTLTIQPGVVVHGANKKLVIFGKLSAIGTIASGLSFDSLHVTGGTNTPSQPFLIDVAFARQSRGSIYSPTGNASYGSLILRNSTLTDMGYLYVWYPTADCYIERNTFIRSGGISTGTSDGVKVYVRNNLFVDQTTTYAVENWTSYNGSATVVEFNSFLTTSKVAMRLPSGYTSALLSGTNNYWNTSDVSAIQGMIFDKNDDLASAGVIAFQPILSQPHAGTPTLPGSTGGPSGLSAAHRPVTGPRRAPPR